MRMKITPVSFMTLLLGILIVLPWNLRAQSAPSVEIRILNSDIKVRKSADTFPLRITIEAKTKPMRFLNLNPLLHANPFVFDSSDLKNGKGTGNGLIFIIEDERGKMIQAHAPHISFVHWEDEIAYINRKFCVDTVKLKINYRGRGKGDLCDTKYSVTEVDSGEIYHLTAYPLLNPYYYLPKGTYFIYVAYKEKHFTLREFSGSYPVENDSANDPGFYVSTYISNKVKFIIK